MKTFAAILALFLAATGPVAAQERPPAAIEGRVTDVDGNPLPSADIVLRDRSTGLVAYGAAADDAGTYRLEHVRPGAYRLEASYVGFARFTLDLRLGAGERRRLPITLSAAAVEHPEVVISANRARPRLTPVTSSSVRRVDLERQPSMKDLPAQLATLPSTTWYSENGNGIGYSYLHIRGFGQRRIAVAVNGIPQNDPEEFNVFWINFFDLQGVVEDIQVQRGAGASVYGPAGIGGAIDIRAMPYRPYPYARVHAGYGGFGTSRLSAEANTGLMGGRWVAFGRASRLRSDGYRDWSWAEFWRFFAGVTRYGQRSTLTVQAYGGPQEDGLAYIGIPKAANKGEVDDGFGGVIDRRFNYSAFTRDREWFHQPHAEVFYNLGLSDRARLEQTLYGIRGIGYFDFDGTFRSADYLRLPEDLVPGTDRGLPLYETLPGESLLFRAVLDQWQAGWLPRLVLTHDGSETRLGLEAVLHRSLRWGRIQEASAGIPAEVVGSGADVRVYSFRGEKAIASAFASHLARPSADWAVQADVQATWRRYRVFDEEFFGTSFHKPYVFLNPRLGVTWRPEQPFSAFASVALASREPRMKSLYDGEEAGAGFVPAFDRREDGSLDTDRPDVEAERVLDVEAGASLRRHAWRLSANAFWMEFSDEIVPSGGLDQFGVPRTGNADRTRHLGLELEGAVRLSRGLDLKGNATLSRNRFVRFTEFVTLADWSTAPASRDDRPIAGFPSWIANAEMVYVRGGLTARVAAAGVGRQYIDNGGGEDAEGNRSSDLWVDPYVLVDAGVRYAFGPSTALDGLEITLDVSNLLDSRVLQFGNVGFGTPQFFPAATRHAFAGLRYTLR
jgi:iron complex outermembrane receptor protein